MTISVLDKVLRPGIISVDCGIGRFQHELVSPDKSCVLDLASPLYYPNKTKIYDRSGNGNHGTITGATWKRTNQGLWYQDFDGSDDNVNCGAGSSLDLRSAVTILYWWKFTSSVAQNVTITKGGYNVGFQHAVHSGLNSSMLVKTAGADVMYRNYLHTPTLNKWHCFAGSYDGSDQDGLHCYFDGASSDGTVNGTGSGDIEDRSAAALIVNGINTRRQQGRLLLLRIFNVVLTADQVAGFFNDERHLFGV